MRNVAGQTMRQVLLTKEERAIRCSEVMGITEPYDIEEASKKFHHLIRCHNRDAHDNAPKSNHLPAELNEVIEFFRGKLDS